VQNRVQLTPLVPQQAGGHIGRIIYNRERTAAEVLQHYDTWTTNQKAEIKNECPQRLPEFS
jgi:hypothetical protein